MPGLLLLLTPSGPTTYEKVGTVASATTLAGAKEFMYGGAPPPANHPPLGGVYDQTKTNGSVVSYVRNGRVVMKVRSGTVLEPRRGGEVAELVRSGSYDESSTGGEVL